MPSTDEKLLYSTLLKLDFLKKYNNRKNVNVLESIVSYKQFSRFNWTSLCLKILSFYKQVPIPSNDQLLALEIFGIATRLLDDLIDKDNEKLFPVPSNILLLLYTDLLAYSINHLNKENSNSLAYLQDAINGEFYDSTLTLEDKLTETIYLKYIINKSSGVFLFYLTQLDVPKEDLDFWINIFQKIGIVSQIKNDLQDVMKPKSIDAVCLKPNFALIKLVQENPDSIIALKNYSQNNDTDKLKDLLESTYIIDYCMLTIEIYKNKIKMELLQKFPNSSNQINNLMSYINIGD
ncbi:class 1 isoprenoid biosynthesis enzyme [Streptococcus ruminantium]|uniref:class 1 isoprenoid biosynthesis enzyme n=1 Tax=Streptococcus ruminantium TaxID=1917441 RepID=UPI0012DF050F|nr:class 1 isoprenoid biosynthesis enzyme [Streptococcus ruminantium]